MDRLCVLLDSSIGKKVQVAAAGLLLCGFLVAHLGGNLFLFAGPDAFNHYAETLENNPLLPLAEGGLAVLFVLHILVALRVRHLNRKARPVGYGRHANAGGSTIGSRTMLASGLLLLAFLVLHLKTFRFTERGTDLFTYVLTAFQSRPYALFYVLAMGALGLHLSHGFQSGFQTLGVNHPRFTPWIKAGGWLFALAVAGGFASLPLWGTFVAGGQR